MDDMSVARTRLALRYVEKAKLCEQNRLKSIVCGKTHDANLWNAMAMYMWTQAEYGNLSEWRDEDDKHYLDRLFLANATGVSDFRRDDSWSGFHSFILSALLDILAKEEFSIAIFKYVAGMSEEEISEYFGKPVKTVSHFLGSVRTKWDCIVNGSHAHRNARRKPNAVVSDGELSEIKRMVREEKNAANEEKIRNAEVQKQLRQKQAEEKAMLAEARLIRAEAKMAEMRALILSEPKVSKSSKAPRAHRWSNQQITSRGEYIRRQKVWRLLCELSKSPSTRRHLEDATKFSYKSVEKMVYKLLSLGYIESVSGRRPNIYALTEKCRHELRWEENA